MTKQEAVSILEKEAGCSELIVSKCAGRSCNNCEFFTRDSERAKALRLVLDILKNGEVNYD